MGVKEFILRCLDQNYRSLLRAVEGLSPAELSWRPNRECNSIGFLVWHYGRVLDRWIRARCLGKPQLWEEGWAERFNHSSDPNYAGFGFTPDQLNAYEAPPLEPLLEYVQAARDITVDYLNGLEDDALATTTIPNPYGGELALETLFQQLIWELNQHGGQVAYLRGVQRGLEDRRYTGGVLN